MKFIRLDKNNQVNGAGLRCVVWISGCENYCDGCHKPESWDYDLGHIWYVQDQTTLDQQLSSPEISGITLTGGDPMAPKNRDAAAKFCAMVKSQHPGKTIWMYTGYTIDTMPRTEVTEEILKNKEHDVYVIDYKQPAIENNRKIFDIKYLDR